MKNINDHCRYGNVNDHQYLIWRISYNAWIKPCHCVNSVAVSIPSFASVDIKDILEILLIHWRNPLKRKVFTELAAVVWIDPVNVVDGINEVTHCAASIASNAMKVVLRK